MASRRRRGKGHTVLELMVVIAIIVTLLAICMPSYVRAVKMARGVAEGTR
jgi:prepilin-type N-terminal cleavage/methylation domain-containing protein